jgi:hypothetical protein
MSTDISAKLHQCFNQKGVMLMNIAAPPWHILIHILIHVLCFLPTWLKNLVVIQIGCCSLRYGHVYSAKLATELKNGALLCHPTVPPHLQWCLTTTTLIKLIVFWYAPSASSTIAAEAGMSEATKALACLANLGHSSSSVSPVRLQHNSGKGQTPGSNTKPATEADICHACGAERGLLRCARCKVALYCSASCQRRHWRNGHKAACEQKTCRDASAREKSAEKDFTPGDQCSLQAGIDASIQSASDHAVSENAQVSDAILRTAALQTSTMTVAVMEFSQDGNWFANALLESPELEPISRLLKFISMQLMHGHVHVAVVRNKQAMSV